MTCRNTITATCHNCRYDCITYHDITELRLILLEARKKRKTTDEDFVMH